MGDDISLKILDTAIKKCWNSNFKNRENLFHGLSDCKEILEQRSEIKSEVVERLSFLKNLPEIIKPRKPTLLLRIFFSNPRHNPIEKYKNGSVPIRNELKIYTWIDCTLKELMMLIKDVNVDSRRRGTTFDFAIVTPNMRSFQTKMKSVGMITIGQRGTDDDKMLSECEFQAGDYLDVAITPARVQNRGAPANLQRPPNGPSDRHVRFKDHDRRY